MAYKSPLTIGGVGYGYEPFSLKGHELKGPNQREDAPGKLRAFGTKDTEFLDQETTDSGTALNFGLAAMGALGLGQAQKPGSWAERLFKGGKSKRTVAPHGDEAHTGGGAVGGEVAEADADVVEDQAVQGTGVAQEAVATAQENVQKGPSWLQNIKLSGLAGKGMAMRGALGMF